MKANELTRLCLDLLRLSGCIAWRNNTGQWGRVRFGYPGSGDIIGVLPGGKFLSVEIKADGDRESEEQTGFREMINRKGGVAAVVRSLSDIEALVYQHASRNAEVYRCRG